MSGMNCKLERLVRLALRPKQERLFHPESPGVHVTVTRTWIDRLLKPKHFASLGETVQAIKANADLSGQ